jgi:Domain of unknown function (DUF4342)
LPFGIIQGEAATIMDKIKALIREGNVRRVIIEHDGRTIAEFPLTAGVVGAVLAPVAAAIAAVVALFKDCTIHVERASAASDGPGNDQAQPAASARAV